MRTGTIFGRAGSANDCVFAGMFSLLAARNSSTICERASFHSACRFGSAESFFASCTNAASTSFSASSKRYSGVTCGLVDMSLRTDVTLPVLSVTPNDFATAGSTRARVAAASRPMP